MLDLTMRGLAKYLPCSYTNIAKFSKTQTDEELLRYLNAIYAEEEYLKLPEDLKPAVHDFLIQVLPKLRATNYTSGMRMQVLSLDRIVLLRFPSVIITRTSLNITANTLVKYELDGDLYLDKYILENIGREF